MTDLPDLPEPDPRNPRAGHALDDWRPTPAQVSTLAGLTVAYLNGYVGSPAELLRACRKPHAAQLVLAMLQLIDLNLTGDRDVFCERLRAAALDYADRDARGASNRTDGLPQQDWSDQ